MLNALGIVGGMGSYATVDFFRRIVDAFPAVKEWDRPRILIDNYCTMPSRVRAILYNERRDELIADLSSSVRNLLRAGAEKIVFACNTSHVFIPEVMRNVPECEGRIIHIIEACAEELRNLPNVGGGGIALLATEGTIETGIYEQVFRKYGLELNSPTQKSYSELRYFIEAVKQNCIDDETVRRFRVFVNSFREESVILGCTELPILYVECIKRGSVFTKRVYDPLQSAINVIVKLRAS